MTQNLRVRSVRQYAFFADLNWSCPMDVFCCGCAVVQRRTTNTTNTTWICQTNLQDMLRSSWIVMIVSGMNATPGNKRHIRPKTFTKFWAPRPRHSSSTSQIPQDRYEIHWAQEHNGRHISLRGERLKQEWETSLKRSFCIIFLLYSSFDPRSSWTAPMAGSPMGSAQLTMVFGDGHS